MYKNISFFVINFTKFFLDIYYNGFVMKGKERWFVSPVKKSRANTGRKSFKQTVSLTSIAPKGHARGNMPISNSCRNAQKVAADTKVRLTMSGRFPINLLSSLPRCLVKGSSIVKIGKFLLLWPDVKKVSGKPPE